MGSLRQNPVARIAGFALLYLLLVQALMMVSVDAERATWATVVGLAFVLYAPVSVAVMRRLLKSPVTPERKRVVLLGLATAPIFITAVLRQAGAAEWTVWAAFVMAVLITAWSTLGRQTSSTVDPG